MPNYQLGKIYCIRSHQTEDIYIGSTCEKYLSTRFSKHKASYKGHKNNKGAYTSSFKILEFDDAYIELIEAFPCDSRLELLAREGHFIRERPCVNKQIAGRNKKQWREDNNDKIKNWRENNKEHLKDLDKEYYQKNKQKIQLRKKLHRESNREVINAKGRADYQKNKDAIKAKRDSKSQEEKDRIKAVKKAYQEKNKEALKAKRRARRAAKKNIDANSN